MYLRRLFLLLVAFFALAGCGGSYSPPTIVSPTTQSGVSVVPTTQSVLPTTQSVLPTVPSTSPTFERTLPSSLKVIPAGLSDPGYNHVTGKYPPSCIYGSRDNRELPVRSCTPGSIRSDVTQDTIGSTICVHGWTGTVRPAVSETNRAKIDAMRAYGEDGSLRSNTELDHYVPLELGGSSDVTNLWPEPSDIPNDGFHNKKDPVENRLKAAVCSHEVTSAYPHGVTLAAAQVAVSTNWTTAESVLGISG